MPPSTEIKGSRVPVINNSIDNTDKDRASGQEVQTFTKKPKNESPTLLADEYHKATNIGRMLVIGVVVVCLWYRDTIQMYIDNLWFNLRDDKVFQSAHYETIYVTVVYTILMIFYPYVMHHIPYFQRFKVSKEVKYVNQTLVGMGIDLIFHLAPLLVADMLIIKRYPGVPYSEIAIRKQNWIVRTRPLPEEPPEFITLCVKVFGSVFLFDIFFTIIHYALHRNLILYKYFHAQHHDHEVVHAHVTNQLSVVERGLQVISANYALKAFGCHPLTRLAFVLVFLWLLIENHTGIDLPWGPHRIFPCNIMGGPAKHHAHHTQGHGNYQPFFTYLDSWLEKRNASKKSKKRTLS